MKKVLVILAAAAVLAAGAFAAPVKIAVIMPSATTDVAFSQSMDDYVESFHTRNGFSRQRMSVQSAAAFDQALHELVSKYCPDGTVRGETCAEVIWGAALAR